MASHNHQTLIESAQSTIIIAASTPDVNYRTTSHRIVAEVAYVGPKHEENRFLSMVLQN